MNITYKKEYAELLRSVKERVLAAQYSALKTVNKELINLYWDIGKMIVEKQEKEGWGKAVVESLSSDLQKEFPGMLGFSVSGLWRIRCFYQSYCKNEKLAPVVREIGWAHNIMIFEKCKNDLKREFYIRMTKKYGWTKNVLAMKIESKTYENTLINQTNFNKTVPEAIKNQAKLAVKDEYTFGFLGLG
jgi:predicted nuclease of restriction endonuclease-like (RecB) superfamily